MKSKLPWRLWAIIIGVTIIINGIVIWMMNALYNNQDAFSKNVSSLATMVGIITAVIPVILSLKSKSNPEEQEEGSILVPGNGGGIRNPSRFEKWISCVIASPHFAKRVTRVIVAACLLSIVACIIVCNWCFSHSPISTWAPRTPIRTQAGSCKKYPSNSCQVTDYIYSPQVISPICQIEGASSKAKDGQMVYYSKWWVEVKVGNRLGWISNVYIKGPAKFPNVPDC